MIPIHPRIDRLQPYVAGIRPEEGTAAIKLNQNESPYPASPKVAETFGRLRPELLLREYPDSGCLRIREALSALHGIPVSMLLCGNGSSELITLLYKSFLCDGDTVAIPDPTFGLYATVAEMAGIRVDIVPTGEDFRIDTMKLLESDPQAVIIANPNAPTGLCLQAAQIERLLQSYRGLVVVDEAYVDFAPEGTSVLGLVDRYDNLLVLRTFSKAYALSGSRIGFAAGNERLIQAMGKGRETFSVNAVAQLAAEAALSDQDYMRTTVERIAMTRQQFCESLERTGWNVLPSVTNFVLASPPVGGRTAKELYERLLSEHIYVRYFDTPRLADKLRISIGTDVEMQVVLDSLARAD
ncbi:histidinol-phosphate transaminase [Paenibacillus hemerocallicola]|uniref:Histidinol-phosphate aminotransferase n=1 Tax=Paenibacillus hemerocallicola TaxID=1172614 RepID=A0A5C4T2B7_9BACL|nr:histidinol-phosphate transaminase [Paenibacillus hemerocallicola]TNJ62269.1 histidinol-phosphate transaminase [Paenibacillus hemerocallicola]